MSIKRINYDETHKIIDGTLYKRCSICSEWKICSEDFFYKNNKNKTDGLQPYCKKCSISKTNQRQKDNHEQYSAYQKVEQLYQRQTPQYKKYSREHTKEQRLSGEYKKWQNNNKERLREYQRKRYESKRHNITKIEWETCKNYFRYMCAYCGMSLLEHKDLFKQDFHKDHVAHNGSNTIDNCVPCCKLCNSEKHNSEFEKWYSPSNPKYSTERLEKILTWLELNCKSE